MSTATTGAGLGLTRATTWGVATYLGITGAVLLLMMIFGTMMRAAQAGYIGIDAEWFYRLMTLHGIGMVGIAGLGAAAIMWHFLRRHVPLNDGVLTINLGLFLLGVVCIFYAALVGGFAGGWTFLYPLPAKSGGAWDTDAAAVHLLGLALVGVGFLILHLETGRAILREYGSLGRALGWPQLFGGSRDDPPPAAVVASTMVLIVNTIGLASGASVIVISLVNLYFPEFGLDPLLAKNMIYFFGHVFINATIYMAVIAVYELLPRYTGRPWKVSKVFLVAWNASILMVMAVYPHHLLMDNVMPTWALVVGQVLSYASGIPVLAVTAFGALVIVYRSGVRWSMAMSLLFLSMLGWSLGVIPAIIDATIIVNRVMHNTMWVPGHFHTYLLLGLVGMVLGVMYHLTTPEGEDSRGIDRLAFWAFLLGALGFVGMFLLAGANSVPRRWAVHWPEWMAVDKAATMFAIVVVAATLMMVLRYLGRIRATVE